LCAHEHAFEPVFETDGAGKTSTINVLSGLVLQSDGQVLVQGHDTLGEMDKVHTLLGVCPQFETVWPLLTGAKQSNLS
jgi:ABC-type multidrug transport system ATPase subunit